jgi:hypothetical protein
MLNYKEEIIKELSTGPAFNEPLRSKIEFKTNSYIGRNRFKDILTEMVFEGSLSLKKIGSGNKYSINKEKKDEPKIESPRAGTESIERFSGFIAARCSKGPELSERPIYLQHGASTCFSPDQETSDTSKNS